MERKRQSAQLSCANNAPKTSKGMEEANATSPGKTRTETRHWNGRGLTSRTEGGTKRGANGKAAAFIPPAHTPLFSLTHDGVYGLSRQRVGLQFPSMPACACPTHAS
uniref:Uncharacterized protein n=1 Tax=Arundo donax TaxID=35708 RepID=A0A0A9HD16_ARUDO